MVDPSTVLSAAKWLGSVLIEEGKYLYGVKDCVRDLQKELESMGVLLQKVDANPTLLREDGHLRILIENIRELSFRAEDTIDTYVDDVGPKVYRKQFFMKLACLVSHSYPLHMIRNEIEAIQKEVQDARTKFDTYDKIVPRASGSQQHGPISSHSAPAENFVHLDEFVVGIEDVITDLTNRLTNADDDFKVLGIIGTGGAGKSTLATKLCRRVESMFPYQSFVSISQQWSGIDVLRRIFEKLTRGKVDILSTQSKSELLRSIHDFMKDKNCLVVLDDIWKKRAWDEIYPIFPCANNSSCRVILTTRKEKIPLYADNKCIIHKPKPLTDAQMWDLFSKVAIEGRSHIKESVVQYETLGREMLEKCSGLPLAVITLAGILRTKQQLYEWENVSKACSEIILKGKGTPNYGVVKDMLELSYLDLPANLKPCFLYLAIIPEDHDIEVRGLIGMWIAEGLVTEDLQGEGNETLEDVGMRFLDKLAHRCVLEVTSRYGLGQIDKFRLHDLMRDLCVKKAKEHQFAEMISFGSTSGSALNQARRIGVFSKLEFHMDSSLRAFVEFRKRNDFSRESGNKKGLGSCKLLRVLIMRGLKEGTRRKCIGKFKHLRFLSVIDDGFREEIPNSIKNLRKLLHLEWSYDRYYSTLKVPNNLVCNMENLRALHLSYSLTLVSEEYNFSLGLNGCKKLQRLESGAGAWMTKDIPTLSPTVQSLAIIDIKQLEEVEAIYQCPSIIEDTLCSLMMWFNVLVMDMVLDIDLQKLRHCKSLRNLDLISFSLVFGELGAPLEFPSNLVQLSLSYCKIEEGERDIMQVLGELSNLKVLSIYRSNNGKRFTCKASAFAQLQELELNQLSELKEWLMEDGAMARLTKLSIKMCKGLKRLPPSIRSITGLKEFKITDMSEEFKKRIERDQDDYYIIQDIPVVNISNVWYM